MRMPDTIPDPAQNAQLSEFDGFMQTQECLGPGTAHKTVYNRGHVKGCV